MVRFISSFARHVLSRTYRFLLFFEKVYVQFQISRKVDECCDIRRLDHAKIKIGFFVVFDSVFSFRRVFELMLKDGHFEPNIIVIPDVSRGEEHMKACLEESWMRLHDKYGECVLSSMGGDGFIDFSGKYDLYYMANVYKGMTHKYYQLPYLARRQCPLITSRYYTEAYTIYAPIFCRLSELSYVWRFYVDDYDDWRMMRRQQYILAMFNRIKIAGNPRLDDFAYVKRRCRNRKKIIIAPHQAFDSKERLCIGTFPMYADFFKDLPRMFPEVDWVFRPHPLLVQRMINSNIWTAEDAKAYVGELQACSNVEVQMGGEYIESFVNSDGLIQDCASFLPEYYLTGKPQCYLFRGRDTETRQFLPQASKYFSGVYKAYCAEDIIHFIKEVVLNERDNLAQKRAELMECKLAVNYPHASEAIVADIKKALKCEGD